MTAPVPTPFRTFRDRPELINRSFTPEQRSENGRKGGRLSGPSRIEQAHVRAVRAILVTRGVILAAREQALVEAACMALARSCYTRGYTSGVNSKHRGNRKAVA